MAVTRIKFPDRNAALQTAQVMRSHNLNPKAIREIERAADRREHLAELHADEAHELEPFIPKLPPRVREPARLAMESLRASEKREAERPRGDALRAMVTKRMEGAPGWDAHPSNPRANT